MDTSVAKAKKAIADYKKAVGTPDGLAELLVFYCEQASSFSRDVGLQDEGYFGALVRMFGETLKAIADLPQPQRPTLWLRIDAVCRAVTTSATASVKPWTACSQSTGAMMTEHDAFDGLAGGERPAGGVAGIARD